MIGVPHGGVIIAMGLWRPWDEPRPAEEPTARAPPRDAYGFAAGILQAGQQGRLRTAATWPASM